MDEFEYVTEMVPEKEAPPPPPLRDVALQGAWFGALAGFAFLGWETAVTGWLGMQAAVGVYPFGVLALYLGTGALFGTIVGVLRLGEGAWSSFATSLVGAWLLCGHVGLLGGNFGLLGGSGGPAVALIGLVALAVLVGYFGVAMNLDDSQAGGVGIGMFLVLAVLIPIDTHYLLTTLSLQGVVWNLGGVIVASAAGALVSLVLADRAVGVLGAMAAGASIGWLAALPVLWTASRDWPVADKTVGPPIVVIVASGLRADHTGAYGAERATTPNIDALAGRGLVYEDAATHAPWSLPAVASLLTSRLPSHHDAGYGSRGQRQGLTSVSPYLPERLAKRGYVTAGITTDAELTVPWGMGRGFDAYDDRTAPAMLPAALHPWRAMGFTRVWASYREAHAITDRALSFVQAQGGRGSWFLLVQYADLAHDEWVAPTEVRAIGGTPEEPTSMYDARVHRVDAEIGRLLAALPAEAWIVVTADHGLELEERRGGPEGSRFEHSLYQEVVHVPLIVVGPGVPPGRVARTVPLLDVAPTLAKLGTADVAGMDGIPLWEVFPTDVPAPPREQVAEHPRVGPDAKSTRFEQFKVIAYDDGTDRLYDLKADPRERSPILQRDGGLTATVRELRALTPPFE